jgi:hypothetical protein
MIDTALSVGSQTVKAVRRPAWSLGYGTQMGIMTMLLSLPMPALAQKIPALAIVPLELVASNPGLADRRAALVEERATLHGRVNSLNARCGAVEKDSAADVACQLEQTELGAALNAHIEKSNEFNAAVQAAKDGASGCRPGDIEIGRQKTAEKMIVYCSRVSCDQISARVKQDIAAQTALKQSMAENNSDLQEWARENEAAQRAALKEATDALLSSVLAFSADKADQKIVRLQNELNRRGQEGETIATKLEKARTFEREYAKWNGISDGLKLGLTPGMNAADTWVRLQEWATKAGKQRAVLSSAWEAFSIDPEVRQIIKEESLDFAFDVLNKGLDKFLAGSFDMAKFLLNYGYDAAKWQASRLQILQRADQADKNLLAECKLDRLMKIDVRNMNVCAGRLPDPNAPDPEAQRCGGK